MSFNQAGEDLSKQPSMDFVGFFGDKLPSFDLAQPTKIINIISENSIQQKNQSFGDDDIFNLNALNRSYSLQNNSQNILNTRFYERLGQQNLNENNFQSMSRIANNQNNQNNNQQNNNNQIQNGNQSQSLQIQNSFQQQDFLRGNQQLQNFGGSMSKSIQLESLNSTENNFQQDQVRVDQGVQKFDQEKQFNQNNSQNCQESEVSILSKQYSYNQNTQLKMLLNPSRKKQPIISINESNRSVGDFSLKQLNNQSSYMECQSPIDQDAQEHFLAEEEVPSQIYSAPENQLKQQIQEKPKIFQPQFKPNSSSQQNIKQENQVTSLNSDERKEDENEQFESFEPKDSEDLLNRPQTVEDEPSSRLKTNISSRQRDQKKKYRQSRHKNVFKNFGSALMRFIQFNPIFKDIIKNCLRNEKKVDDFNNWMTSKVKLERKQDFINGWTWYVQDEEKIRGYKELLRELSLTFFQDFAMIYLMNSKKLDDLEIHLRSIQPFILGINKPESLQRFKPR